ncbi:MAG: hypothetical protein ABI765_02200 [Gemmatimonadota bacterium]
MDNWYAFALFIHVSSTMALAAALGIMTVCELRIGNAWTLEQLRDWVGLADRTGKALGMISPVLLLSALYLVHLRWSYSSAWVIGALMMFLAMALSGRLVVGQRLLAILDAGIKEGGVSPGIRKMIENPILRWHPRLRVGIFAWLLSLMTIKPGFEITVGTLVLAIAISVVLIQLDRTGQTRGVAPVVVKGGR